MSTDYDSPWKEALDFYFDAFLALLFPDAHTQIDWSRGYESLDKEFQQIVREAEVGRKYVDKLVKVWTKAGIECWVLIHVEVQADRDADFPLRMFVYHYRIFDRYNVPVASFAVLADDDPNWRPAEFRQYLFGCEAVLRFPAAKLLDLPAKEAELEASANPFSKFVLAHLKAKETHGDPANRQLWKLRLMRGLLERGFRAKDVRELFRLIDWVMVLPRSANQLVWQELQRIQEEKKMPFISSLERFLEARALRKGIEAFLKFRFGDAGAKLMPEINEIHDEEILEAILNTAQTANSPDEIRGLWSPPATP